MASITEEDRRRLLEGRHDIAALHDASKLTGDEALKGALVRSVERLSEARVALLSASQHSLKESTESGEARIDLEGGLSAAHRQYAFVRQKVSSALFTVDPDEPPLPSGEMEKRALVFNKVFTETIGPLSSLGPERFLEILEEVAQAMERAAPLAALSLHGRLERAAASLKLGLERWKREGVEDREALSALNQARAHFDRELSGHADQVRSVLRREDAAQALGRYVLSRDPAYRARRKAGKPLDDEPGIKDVDTEAGATPGSPVDPGVA